DKMVFASIGNISPKRIKEIAERYLGIYAPTKRDYERVAPTLVEPFERTLNKHTHQAHCIIGARAYNLRDNRRLPYALFTNILGGPCANSRLNVSVRERNGLTYNIGASYSSLSDCGLATIYFSSDHENSERCREIIGREVKRLQDNALTARQLSMAKRQFVAQLAIVNEAAEGYMLGVGKSLLAYGEVDTLEESYRKINAVTASEIMGVANEVWREPSVLLYK
ncbi:MAG: insulinase family protein, partial [Alistipes sp.]|nr:insulinase family protein [Alistipes sp.]